MKQLYYNGTIVTVNDSQPLADALLLEDGTISAVGAFDELQSLRDDETVLIDLAGKTMLPGFIDGHGHIGNLMAGLPKLYAPPMGIVDSKETLLSELRRMLKEERMENGWLIAMGYDNAFFENNAHPTRAELDAISTDVPILVLHASGHVGTVNSKAIEIVGWTKDTPNPEGGLLQHDPTTGELNGIIEEKAIHIVGLGYAMQGLSTEALVNIFLNTQNFYASKGLTTAEECSLMTDTMEIFDYCREQGKIYIDIVAYPMLEYAKAYIPDDTSAQQYDRHVKIAGAKVVADGSPQAKTAWLTEPYYIQPENAEDGYRGYPIYTDEQMVDYCQQALEHNWQMMVHCNGDATADQLLHAYQKAQQITGNKKNLRPVMVHAQTVREDQLDAMKEIGMMPSYFHDHVFYWGDYHYESVLGPERASRISPLASTVKRGLPFTLHNDSPVTPVDPIFNIHNAVNRVTRDGRKLGQEYCVDVMEAIKAVTIYGAYQHFDEALKGSLEVGKLADLVILDKNPLTVPKETIKDINVLATIKEGKTVYKAE